MKNEERGHVSLVSYGGYTALLPMSHAATAEEAVREVPSLEDVFRAHHAFVYRCVRRLGVPEAQAEDMTQEVFLVVQRRLDQYEERGSMRSWLYRIAQRVASTHLRGELRAQKRLEKIESPESGATPEAELQRQQAAAAVREFLESLDEDQRMVFVLSDIEGLRAAEIADAVGVGVNTVYSRLRLARQKFNRFVSRHRARSEGESRGRAD